MGAIAVDRCIALHYHLRYVQLVTTRRAIYLSTTLWIVAFIFLFLTLLENHVFAVTVAVSTATCLLTCLACYVRIYFIVRRHQLQIMVQERAVAGSINGNNHNMRESRNTAKNTFIFYIVLIMCYTPLSVTWLVVAISPTYRWPMEWIVADTLLFMNSSINPFLYCWRLSELREAVVNMAKQISCK